ncbi:MAG: DUF4268 domain-containing protein [Candidatus Hydrogenedens sp.]|nr:DUF4268 domain-containing protein [Candidatus Hydrogenedens sp.]
MTGTEAKLAAYMKGNDKRFVIPVYQRNYDWKIENCKQLFDDLVKVVDKKRKSHFFGSIVSVYDNDARKEEYLIIDGQQRLTTVSLMLLAVYHLLTEGLVVSKEERLDEQILKGYLIDEYHPKDSRIKLKPVKNDKNAFDKLFDSVEDHIQSSNVTINYNYFRNRILKAEIGIDDLFDAICRLEIISIKLNQDDNPQLIFESLNSTGLALSEGDKIRNYILMGLPSDLQADYYEKYWNKIETCTRFDVSAFVRDYLSVKQQSIPAQSKIYFTFKDFVEESELQTEELLQDLLSYARRYAILLDGKTSNTKLNATISRLNRLETTVTRPFFLEVLRLNEEGKLSVEQVADVFAITESYLFRRTICELPTNSLNKIFLLLHREIMRLDKTADNYIEKFKYSILSKKERARFPLDGEFQTALSERQVYAMNSKNKIYIMERLENYGTLEDKDIYRHVDDGTYTIEHIMPQHLSPTWISLLGETAESVHAVWLHRLANLTLTAYNSKYSNSTFAEKKTVKNGFNESGIRMNTQIARYDQWTEDELIDRNQVLMKLALSIWPLFPTDYLPEEKQLDTCSLEDDELLRRRVIEKFRYKSAEQPVESWIEMFISVIRMLHEEDRSVLPKIAFAPDGSEELSTYISANMNILRGAVEVDEGIFVEKNTSTETKLSLLRRIFRLYDADPADLLFYLRDSNVSFNKANISDYEENRIRYWTYALPRIKEVFGPTGPFSYVNPTKSNWIAGGFGIGGFSISCVANYDGVRVELYMAAETQFNKMMFDHLSVYKAEIEAKVMSALQWDRGDDKKSSKVFVSNPNLNVSLESDWLQITDFFLDWSKKFFDVLVPLLKQKSTQ